MNNDQTQVLERPENVSTADLAKRASVNTAAVTLPTTASHHAPLFPDNELNELRQRWQNVQSGFVDDPRSSVRTADELVASLMTRLAQVFADERGKLEHEWDKGEDVSTEDLRVALQRYR